MASSPEPEGSIEELWRLRQPQTPQDNEELARLPRYLPRKFTIRPNVLCNLKELLREREEIDRGFTFQSESFSPLVFGVSHDDGETAVKLPLLL